MADHPKDFLPGFKKKRQGKAKSLRDKISDLIKEPARPVASFSQMKNIPEASTSGKPMEYGDVGSYKEVNAEPNAEMGVSPVQNAIDAVKKAQAEFNPGEIPEVKFSTKRDSKADIQASDKGNVEKTAESGTDRADMHDSTKDSESEYDISPEKEYQLSLRYQMPPKLANLDKEKLKKLAEWIHNQLRDIQQERVIFMEKLMRYRAVWLDFVAVGMNPLWEGAHNVHIPMAFEKIKAMHARIYQAVFGIDPPFSLKPRNPVSDKQKFEKEQLLNFIVKDYANKGRGWEAVIDKDIWNFCADGTSVTKQYWCREVNKYTDIRSDFVGFKNGKPIYKEKNIEKEEIEFDGPMIKQVDLEDFFITGINTDSTDEADLVAERLNYTKSDLIKLSRQGYFFEDAITDVIKNEPMLPLNRRHVDATMLKQEKYDLAGVVKETSGIKTYECYESYCRYDIDDDGIDEELVVWTERSTGKVLRLTYLERACPGKMRPFTIKRFIDRPGSPYGIGLGEMLYGINNELDYIHNQRLDYGTLQNLPFGFIRASSELNQPKPIRLAPGTLYPTDDPIS